MMSFTKVFMILSLSFSAIYSQFEIEALQNLTEDSKKSKSNFSKYRMPTDLSSTQFNDNNTFENSLDEKTYFVGGGDVFSISLANKPSQKYSGVIDQAGYIFFPEIGLLQLNKISLDSAKKEIAAFFSEKLKKTDVIYVTLEKAKYVTLNITGSVASPGTIILPGYYRLFDALKAANNKQPPDWNDCDYRNVICTGKDTTYYDLYKYILKGDIYQNPYIYPGDNIRINLATKQVLLNGAIEATISGNIPIKQNEKFKDFISLFAFNESADTGNILITNNLNNQSATSLFVTVNTNSDYVLQDQDVITIPVKKGYPHFISVSITGEINRPGDYPIRKETTLLQNIIDQAGGISNYADLERAVIIRHNKIYNDKNTSDLIDQNKFLSVRPEISSALTMMIYANDQSIISINKRTNISLEDNDIIFIPKKEYYIYISGSVKKPGGYEFISGKKMSYYIEQAGGFTRNADKSNVYCITRYNDVIQTTDGSNLKPGDIIVIPVSQQNKMLSTVILPIFQAVVTTTSVILGIYATTK